MLETTTPRPARRQHSPASRAALRPVEAGNYVDCARCGERVKFQAKARKLQVICNVYVDGRWNRVEHYHAECYDEAGRPHGPVPDQGEPRTARAS